MYATIIENSTAALPASSTFTSQTIDVSPGKKLIASVLTDQAGTLYIKQSSDGASWSTIATLTISPNIETIILINPTKLYGRVELTNSTNPQGVLKLFTATTNESLLVL